MLLDVLSHHLLNLHLEGGLELCQPRILQESRMGDHVLQRILGHRGAELGKVPLEDHRVFVLGTDGSRNFGRRPQVEFRIFPPRLEDIRRHLVQFGGVA